MTVRVALVACTVLAAACGKTDRTPEPCTAFFATVDKIAGCKALPEAARTLARDQAAHVRSTFEMLDDLEGTALEQVQRHVGELCTEQDQRIRDLYRTVAPDCLK